MTYNRTELNENVDVMHFIYQINRLTTMKEDSTYLGSLTNKAQFRLMYSEVT